MSVAPPHVPTLLALAFLVACVTPAVAQSPAPATPPVAAEAATSDQARNRAAVEAAFAALAKSSSDAEAQDIAAEIVRLWTRSGRPDVDALMARAASAMATRDLGLAALLLDEIVALAPEFAEGWNRRATLRWIMSDHAGSMADIEKVLALEPRHFGALAGRASIHADAGRHREALADYRRALAANPFLPERRHVLPMLERRARGEL